MRDRALFSRRVGAYLIDSLLIAAISTPLVVGLVYLVLDNMLGGVWTEASLTELRMNDQDTLRLGASVLVATTAGMLIWSVIAAARHGRTPGRRLLGVRLTPADASFPWHFSREFLGRQVVPMLLVFMLPLIGVVAAAVWLGLGLSRADGRGAHDIIWDSDIVADPVAALPAELDAEDEELPPSTQPLERR